MCSRVLWAAVRACCSTTMRLACPPHRQRRGSAFKPMHPLAGLTCRCFVRAIRKQLSTACSGGPGAAHAHNPMCASMAVPRHPANPAAIALAAPPCSGWPSPCPWPRPGLPAAIAGVAARAVLLLQWCCGCERCPMQCHCATSATLPVAPKVPEHCQWPNALVWPVQCH